MAAYSIRPLEQLEEYEACVKLQEHVWGKGFSERVPASILLVAQKLGGLVAGAFTPSNTLIGFVFGLTGPMEGQLVHWSDMLGVHTSWRGKGIGRSLKWYQRSVMLERGIPYIFWTYEPLEARNAYINLHVLGAEVYAYVPSMYPEHTGSPLHQGLGMDRLIVRWDVQHPRVEALYRGNIPPLSEEAVHAPALLPDKPTLPAHPPPAFRVAIPSNIQELKQHDLKRAQQWRRFIRAVFQRYLPRYRVIDFQRYPDEPLAYYIFVHRKRYDNTGTPASS